ncbi:MAG: succinate dehydrogenase cytochrome b subunit [Acidobacteriota bacterium]
MVWILDLYRSPMAKKVVMAGTGLILFGFVFVHMLGNLKLYAGPESLDTYAHFLREVGYPLIPKEGVLWAFRFGLLAAVGLHILSAWQLTQISHKARPQKYAHAPKRQESTYASRTMRWGGVILLLFIVYHLLHLTTGSVHPEFEHGAVYSNVVAGFQNPLVAGFYIIANIALGFHLFHGLWSLFQTLGWNGERFNQLRKAFAVTFALLVAGANISFPIAVLTGIVSPADTVQTTVADH